MDKMLLEILEELNVLDKEELAEWVFFMGQEF